MKIISSMMKKLLEMSIDVVMERDNGVDAVLPTARHPGAGSLVCNRAIRLPDSEANAYVTSPSTLVLQLSDSASAQHIDDKDY